MCREVMRFCRPGKRTAAIFSTYAATAHWARTPVATEEAFRNWHSLPAAKCVWEDLKNALPPPSQPRAKCILEGSRLQAKCVLENIDNIRQRTSPPSRPQATCRKQPAFWQGSHAHCPENALPKPPSRKQNAFWKASKTHCPLLSGRKAKCVVEFSKTHQANVRFGRSRKRTAPSPSGRQNKVCFGRLSPPPPRHHHYQNAYCTSSRMHCPLPPGRKTNAFWPA